MKTQLVLIAGLQLLAQSGYCWSAPGHQAIAQAALEMLKGTPAEAQVNSILDGEPIEDAAIWLDRVREHFRFQDPSEEDEARFFERLFPGSPNWHFCNYIVGSTNYDFGSKYSSNDDVVHALETAIRVLEGSPSKMTKLQALRTVIHLVGDIHQPLHCITGYYDITDPNNPVLLSDVSDPKTATEDRGGNELFYTASQELHALWDLGLPRRVSPNIPTLAAKLEVALDSQPQTDGDFHHWPELLASASMRQANEAYKGITFKSASFVDDPRHPGQQKLIIAIDLPGGERGYKSHQQPRARDQLTAAAVHLAQLLQRIQFQ